MKHIEKLKVFSKRLLLHVAAQALPGPAQLIYEVAKDFYQIFMVAEDDDRQALIEAACEMTDAELSSLITELSQQFGQAQAQAIEGVLSTLRVRPQTHNALQRINQTMLSSSRQTLQPTAFSARQRVVGSAVVSSMLTPRQAHQGRAVHPSRWPQIDGFEIKSFLGRGTFAEVYLAHELDSQGRFKRSCALKVGDLNDIKRFNREVNALQHVQHENLIDYYGSGILQDPPPPRFWIAMPNLSGITLGDLMRGGLDVEQKLMLSMQALAGLRALHEKRLSHRDLKPENALITDDFNLKLTDFGLSKNDGQEEHASLLTMGGDMLGTPAYMSPEQVKGIQSGMESDVWAFGVIVYELFVGTLPFVGNVGEILGKIQYETIQWNHQKIPKQLKSVMQKCLDRDLNRRYPSAIELSREFMPKAEQWRSALRHERYRGNWNQVFERDLFVRFAEQHEGDLPLNASQAFVFMFPELPELDEERLDEVLPAVFSAYQKLLRARQELSGGGKDWGELIERAERAAVAALGLQSMDEAIARAVEVGEVKSQAKREVLRRKEAYEQRRSELRQRIRDAESGVSLVAQEILREELSDYQSLLAERERIRHAEEAERERQQEAERVRVKARKKRKRLLTIGMILVALVAGIVIFVQVEQARVKAEQTRIEAEQARIEAERKAEQARIAAKARAAELARLKQERIDKGYHKVGQQESLSILRQADEYYNTSKRTAALLYEEACRLKSARGCIEWAHKLYYGTGTPKDTHKAKLLVTKERIDQVQILCSRGEMKACTRLGFVYYDGLGVTQDFSKAFSLYQKAARAGEAIAQGNLGISYALGKGVKQDDAEAVRWFQKAAEQGYTMGQTNLGFMYQRGRGVKQDYAEAIRWYQKAVEQGDTRGQTNLGSMYEYGEGVKQDYAEAVRWYRKAAEQGDAMGQTNLGNMYFRGYGVKQDYTEAIRWYRKAAEQGGDRAYVQLGSMYEYGEGVKQDYAEAVRWYRKVAEQGYAPGQTSLGNMYSNGKGVKQDQAEAVRWYRKAAEQGDARGQTNLGRSYALGKGVKQDYTEAVRWCRKAAEQGDVTGQTNLGLMYSNGWGVKQDYAEAVRWYRKAAEQGDATGQTYLGTMYSNGLGVKQDHTEAKRWYQKAAEQGDARALKILKDLK